RFRARPLAPPVARLRLGAGNTLCETMTRSHGGGIQVELDPVSAQGVERVCMAPLIGPHDLIVDPILQQRRDRRTLEDMVKPLITQLTQVHERGRIDRVASQDRLSPPLSDAIIVWPDEQSVLSARVVMMMLIEVIQRTRLAGRVVPRDRQYRNVDLGELAPIRDEGLPEPIITGVIQPAQKIRIGLAIEGSQVAIPLATRVPFLIQ